MLRFLDISTLFSALVVVFGLITSIFLHELGHLMMCWLLRFQVQAVIILPVAENVPGVWAIKTGAAPTAPKRTSGRAKARLRRATAAIIIRVQIAIRSRKVLGS